jgi:hypothetical protein
MAMSDERIIQRYYGPTLGLPSQFAPPQGLDRDYLVPRIWRPTYGRDGKEAEGTRNA